MTAPAALAFRDEIARKNVQSSNYPTEVVDLLLRAANVLSASDVHLLPTPEGLDVRWRLDGVLQPVAVLPADCSPKVVARLKVLADLLTYRNEVPQEGRIRQGPGGVEMRVSTFPTLHGEKAVVRLFSGAGRFDRLDDLGLPDDIVLGVRAALSSTSGALIFSGPAGSGKTTTIYACLREIAAMTEGRRSLCSLEDPIEVAVPGVSQTQVNPNAGLTLESGLRAVLRHDPEVIAVGEIRDRATAEVAFQASLTGHLVLTTYHAGSAAGVIGRLGDMGIEPYLLRSGVIGVVSQRLVRKLCVCSKESNDPTQALGLGVEHFSLPVGCPECAGTGYRGRTALAEMLVPGPSEIGRAILSRDDVANLERLAVRGGMITRWDRARAAIESGLTSPAEVRRALGLDGPTYQKNTIT